MPRKSAKRTEKKVVETIAQRLRREQQSTAKRNNPVKKKKLKLQWAGKHTGEKTNEAPVYYRNPTSMGRFRPKPQSMPPIGQDTDEYIFSLLQPWEAYHRGYEPSVPDGNMMAAYRFRTKTILQTVGVSNTFTSSYDNWYAIYPFGNTHAQYAPSFNPATGVPSSYTPANVLGYGNWGTNFSSIRCVAMGVVIRNLTKVTDQAGTILQTVLQWDVFNGKNFADLTGPTQTEIRGLGVPGDMGLRHWKPGPDGSADKDFKPYNSSVGSYTSSNGIVIWSQSPTAQQLQLEVFAFWEARPTVDAQALLPATTKVSDPAMANRKLQKALNRLPEGSQARMVAKDDGAIESIADDIKSVFGGIKGGINLVKNIGETVGGWLGFSCPHEGIHRVLNHFTSNDYKECFDTLVAYILEHPNATLSDVLAWCYSMEQKAKMKPRLMIEVEEEKSSPSLTAVSLRSISQPPSRR